MLSTTARQPSLFYVALGHQASLIKDDLLDPVDALLDDAGLVEMVREAQAKRSPNSRTTGRYSVAPDRLVRCCVLKHIKNWSFRELERELRSGLGYRRFTRFDEAPIPDFSTFSRNFAVLGLDVTEKIHAHVVARARAERVSPGRKLRTDTTVVETNVHYPTDSTLLQDGIRVLTRSVKRIAKECLDGTVKIVDHGLSAQRRVIEIHRAAKSYTDSARGRLQEGYRKLVGLAHAVVRRAEKVADDLNNGGAPIVGSTMSVVANEGAIRHYLPLVKKVIAQTKARVFGGDIHVQGKVLSLFEEHTHAIRKGKAHKPTEFGRLVRIDEVENGIVSGYAVQDGNPADAQAWMPALEQHQKTFGRAPRMATADRGYFSAKNEADATKLGVQRVVLPARGPLSAKRAALQKEPWFRRALRWRGGIEPRIATLKHRFGMKRAQYKGDSGFKRFVGWSVISQNLVSIVRVITRRGRREGAAEVKAAK